MNTYGPRVWDPCSNWTTNSFFLVDFIRHGMLINKFDFHFYVSVSSCQFQQHFENNFLYKKVLRSAFQSFSFVFVLNCEKTACVFLTVANLTKKYEQFHGKFLLPKMNTNIVDNTEKIRINVSPLAHFDKKYYDKMILLNNVFLPNKISFFSFSSNF